MMMVSNRCLKLINSSLTCQNGKCLCLMFNNDQTNYETEYEDGYMGQQLLYLHHLQPAVYFVRSESYTTVLFNM